jgi:AraC family transcriptional regulator
MNVLSRRVCDPKRLTFATTTVYAAAIASSGQRSEGADSHDLTTVAATILADVRRAVEMNRPEGARAAALRLVSLLDLSSKAEPARGGLAPWQQRKIDRYLRDHLERPVLVNELANQIPLSVSHFCRAFKETFGDTPHAYLMRLRLELAQKTMLATDEPLSQIALASGFADQAHLSKLFRRIVGETPSAWRRRNLDEEQVGGRTRRAVASLSCIE